MRAMCLLWLSVVSLAFSGLGCAYETRMQEPRPSVDHLEVETLHLRGPSTHVADALGASQQIFSRILAFLRKPPSEDINLQKTLSEQKDENANRQAALSKLKETAAEMVQLTRACRGREYPSLETYLEDWIEQAPQWRKILLDRRTSDLERQLTLARVEGSLLLLQELMRAQNLGNGLTEGVQFAP